MKLNGIQLFTHGYNIMSLKTIRNDIASELGFHPASSDDDRSYLDDKINKTALDLYNSNDLTGSLKELIMFYSNTAKIISLPNYVGEIRASRYYDTPYTLSLRDIRPRYSTSGFSMQLIDPREIGYSSLAVQITNASRLKFSLPEGETEVEDVEISIVGRTPISSNLEEKVTIKKGENSITTENDFVESPRSITKSAASKFDILVTDADNVELALIPNNQLASQYKIFQIRDDRLLGQVSANSIEVLYKERFQPMVNDGDEFLSSLYDECIMWKFLAEYWSKLEGKAEQVDMATNNYAARLANVHRSQSKGKVAELQTVENKFYSLFDKSSFRKMYN